MGEHFGVLQRDLTELWKTHGPDAVYARIATLPQDQLVTLLMLNVGRDASA